jgi:hypothetical protein
MTEETTQEQNPGFNISVEQILASIINTIGDITVPLEKLVANYGDKTIAVNQNEDKSVVFSLINASEVPASQETAE